VDSSGRRERRRNAAEARHDDAAARFGTAAPIERGPRWSERLAHAGHASGRGTDARQRSDPRRPRRQRPRPRRSAGKRVRPHVEQPPASPAVDAGAGQFAGPTRGRPFAAGSIRDAPNVECRQRLAVRVHAKCCRVVRLSGSACRMGAEVGAVARALLPSSALNRSHPRRSAVGGRRSAGRAKARHGRSLDVPPLVAIPERRTASAAERRIDAGLISRPGLAGP
jgi:hypothetical protein